MACCDIIVEQLHTIVRYDILMEEEILADPIIPKQVITYADSNGREPFTKWLNRLRDSEGRYGILKRIHRLEQGNCGDCEPVGEGVSELRIFFGPGYRVYFGEHGNNIVVLLCGGGKDSQKNDIQQAKEYWKDYKNEKLQNHR